MTNPEGPPSTDVAEGAVTPAPRAPAEPKTAVAPTVAPAHEVRLRDGLGFASAVITAVWVGWALLSVLAIGMFKRNPPTGVPGLDAAQVNPGWINALLGGNRADALWFERIALDGYRTDDGSAAFFPLYPSLLHTAHAVGFPIVSAGLLIAWAAYFAALVVLYALTTRELGEAVARRATVYLAVFPTAFFFLSPFTESLFLLLVLLTFWYARSGRWWWAIAPAALAGLTRSVGIVLVAALAVEALSQFRRGKVVPKLLATLAPAAGLGLYFAYWAVVRKDLWAPVHAQKNWGREWTLPVRTLYQAVVSAYDYQSYWLIDLVIVAVPLIAILAGFRLIPASYTVYAAVSLAMPLADPFMMRPLMSVPRFVVVLFPAFWVLAVAAQRRWIPHSAVVGFFAGGFVLMGSLYVTSYAIF